MEIMEMKMKIDQMSNWFESNENWIVWLKWEQRTFYGDEYNSRFYEYTMTYPKQILNANSNTC